MFAEVVRYHDRGTDAFHFLRFSIYDALGEMKTFCSDFCYGGLYGNVVGTINLRKKIGFYMDDDDAVFLPVDMRTYGSKIFCLTQIIKREVDGVVDVTEFVDVVEAQLYR